MAKYIERCVEGTIQEKNCFVHFGHKNEELPMSIVQVGWHQTDGGYGYGPMIRDHWLLHFVLKGNGIVQVENMEYEAGAAQIFAIRPHQITYYEASISAPWEYFYIGFEGGWAPRIMKDIGFINDDIIVIQIPNTEEIFRLLKKIRRYIKTYLEIGDGVLGIHGCIYEIFQLLSEGRNDDQIISEFEKNDLLQHEYTRTLISIIETSFAEKINIQELANRLHLNRSYMSELFSKDTGMSIKSYLTEKRMQRAAIMLQDPNRSVKNVAASCGFEDSLYFSRAFSKYFGISPQQYRSQILKDKKK